MALDTFCRDCGGKMYFRLPLTDGGVKCGACGREQDADGTETDAVSRCSRFALMERIRLAGLLGCSMILSGAEAKVVLSLIQRGEEETS